MGEFFSNFSVYKHLPELASKNGADIDRLIEVMHWLMWILAIGWSLFFIYCLVRFRQSRNPKASYEGLKSHASSLIEAAVVLVEAILLIGFSIPYWSQKIDTLPKENVFNIRVVAEQFAWNIHYPGADGVFGITDAKFMDPQTNPLGLDPSDPNGKDDLHTVNDLVIPVNRPIVAQITSKDVIHSFALQEMRVKQDAIPGMEIPANWEAIKTGKWEISCAQLCGLGHYTMRGDFTVLAQEEFDTWMAGKVQEKAGAGTGGSGDDFWN